MAVKNETRKRTSKKGRVWEVTYTLVKDIPEKKTAKKTKAKPAKATKAKAKAKPAKGKAATARGKAKAAKRKKISKTKS